MPTEWKKACTVLAHKKGNNGDPSSIKPITLESVTLKVVTSCLRYSIFTFLKENNFNEVEIQNGFTPKVLEVLEHTSMMVHIINKAHIQQRSVAIPLPDVKNAFGEVHHNLISKVRCYNHVPRQAQALVSSFYENFHNIHYN